jgi:sterol 14-demethylase
LTFLGGHPDWRNKAAVEVQKLLSASSSDPSQPLSKRLASISLETWESETPVLDSIIRETTRVAQPHTAMRRNLGPDLYIDDKLIPSGAYVIYPFSDVHLDPDLYPDPWKFDPGRKEPEGVPYSYIGWGGGKHLLSNTLSKILRLTAANYAL